MDEMNQNIETENISDQNEQVIKRKHDMDCFHIPDDILSIAKLHIQNCIYFSPTGITCPTNNEQIECNQETFINSKLLFSHILVYHEKMKNICGVCPIAYEYFDQLLTHYRIEHENLIYYGKVLLSAIYLGQEIHQKWMMNEQIQPNGGTPIKCIHKENAPFIMVCQYPGTGIFITTMDEIKQMMVNCFKSEVLASKNMLCPMKLINKVCGRKYNTCRELTLHIITHTGFNAVCKYCCELYYDTEDYYKVFSHIEKAHKMCVVCDIALDKCPKFNLKLSTTPYMNPKIFYIDVNCALFLPNFAFHRANMNEIDYEEALERDHDCVELYGDILRTKSLITLSSRFLETVKLCMQTEMVIYKYIDYSSCGCEQYSFRSCRDILIHMLLIHLDPENTFMYICPLCKELFKTNSHLFEHIDGIHDIYICRICSMYFENYINLSEHQLMMGHLLADK